MEGLPGHDRLRTPDMVRARVLQEAQRRMTHVEATELESCVQAAVSGLWTEQTRVTTFIPVLALREVREILERKAVQTG